MDEPLETEKTSATGSFQLLIGLARSNKKLSDKRKTLPSILTSVLTGCRFRNLSKSICYNAIIFFHVSVLCTSILYWRV
jgi:hypothetical protein